MTREEAIAFFEDMNKCTYGNLEAVEMAISALSTEGEYIKKEHILNELGDTNMDILTNEVKEIVNSLPSYSIPDSDDIEKIRAEIEESWYITQDPIYARGLETALEIIDKHIGGASK